MAGSIDVARKSAFLILLTTLLAGVEPGAGRAGEAYRIDIDRVAGQSGEKLLKTAEALGYDINRFPSVSTLDLVAWQTSSAAYWTSGYFPGCLWLMYELTGDRVYLPYARMWTHGLRGQVKETAYHDIGHIIFYSFGNGWRLTGDPLYMSALIEASRQMEKLYDPAIGCVRSWPPGTHRFPVIIDGMVALELMLWAGIHGALPDLVQAAESHARKTALNHVRENGSTWHVVDYNPDGSVRRKCTQQGYADWSTWARGQAWAIYGFARTFRYIAEPLFLETAIRTADYFLANLPADRIPFYDFDDPRSPDVSKDSSAAAIACSGLLEIFEHTGERRFLQAAADILAALLESEYSGLETQHAPIILRGCVQKNERERGLIYGDYYFLEALEKYSAFQLHEDPEPAREIVDFKFAACYPNPFNSVVNLVVHQGEAGRLTIEVFDAAGRLLCRPVDAAYGAGMHTIQFSPDRYGINSGVMFCRITSSALTETIKLVQIR